MRRGRPKLLDSEDETWLRDFFKIAPGVTKRTLQNANYLRRALTVLWSDGDDIRLENEKRWAWLLRPESSRYSTRYHYRLSILYQLGRIEDLLAIKIFADRLCELKPTTQEALFLLRRWTIRYDEEFMRALDEPGDLYFESVARKAVQE